MNCYNHPGEVAVASCVDCGKGLCKKCTGIYQIPICDECNLKRVKADKGTTIKIYLPSIILFIIGIIVGVSGYSSLYMGILFGYLFGGIPWGWKIVTFIQPRMFLFLSFFGWVMYFFIKLSIASFVGMIAFPIGLIKLIVSLVSAHKKEKDINNNLANKKSGMDLSSVSSINSNVLNSGDFWVCKKCNEKNPNTAPTCKSCGAYK